jgi:hypothetical protein
VFLNENNEKHTDFACQFRFSTFNFDSKKISTLARHAARASTVILEVRPANAGLTRPVSS